jgi:hypothetical protein
MLVLLSSLKNDLFRSSRYVVFPSGLRSRPLLDLQPARHRQLHYALNGYGKPQRLAVAL